MPTPSALLLVRAAHPRQAVASSAVLAAAAAVAGRPLREVALVAATVLVGQTIVGWADDLTDRRLHHTGLDPGLDPASEVVATQTFLQSVPASGTDTAAVAQAFRAALGAIAHDIAGWTLVNGNQRQHVKARKAK